MQRARSRTDACGERCHVVALNASGLSPPRSHIVVGKIAEPWRRERCLNAPCEYDAGMSRRYLLLAATSLLAACPPRTATPSHPVSADPGDIALRIRVAQAEARRAGGVAELAELATH